MKTILLISDTHGFLDPMIQKHLRDCDELWHAGDIGTPQTLLDLEALCKKENQRLRIVYGNIDGHVIRKSTPKFLEFSIEKMKAIMLHIGGKPPRYAKDIKSLLQQKKPNIFICGHSHILRVQYDKQLNCMYLNPGACGNHGFHKVNTMLKFVIEENKIHTMNIIEWPRNTKRQSADI